MTLTRRFGLLISIIIFIIFIINSLVLLIKDGTISGHLIILVLPLVSILMFFTSNYNIGKYVQVFTLSLTTALTFFTNPDSGYGVGQLVIMVLLCEKYGFFKTKVIFKTIFTSFLLIACLSLSLYIKHRSMIYILSPLLFLLVYIVSFIIIKYEEIQVFMAEEKALKEEIKSLKQQITKSGDFINPVSAGLTNTEIILLKNLCIYKETNGELAKRLSKSQHTIKTQLKSISKKIGAENRHQLIDLCKFYFS